MDKRVEYTSEQVASNIIADQTAIHFRYAMCLITTMPRIERPWIVSIPIIMHLGVLTSNILYIKDQVKQKRTIEYYPPSDKTREFVKFIFGSTGICLALDVVVALIAFECCKDSLNIAFGSILCIMIIYIEPFYDLNHLAFHLAAILNGICIANLFIQ